MKRDHLMRQRLVRVESRNTLIKREISFSFAVLIKAERELIDKML